MKIAMIGSGAAGSVFASYLKIGGADMYLVDRYKAHMDKIACDGLCFCQFGEEKVLKASPAWMTRENWASWIWSSSWSRLPRRRASCPPL